MKSLLSGFELLLFTQSHSEHRANTANFYGCAPTLQPFNSSTLSILQLFNSSTFLAGRVHGGQDIEMLLKIPGEVFRVIKAYFVGHFRDGELTLFKQLCRALQPYGTNKFKR